MLCIKQPHVVRGCVLFAGLALSWVSAGPARAVVYYVRASGSDAADGRNPATALASLSKAASLLTNAGDRVVVGPGRYSEGNVTPPRDGIDGFPLVFFADVTGMQTGDAAGPVVLAPVAPATTGFLVLGRHHIVVDGFTIVAASDAGVQVRRAADGIESHTITVRNVTARDGTRRGIDISAYGAVTLESCHVLNNRTGGIVVQGTAGVGAVLDLRNNEAADNGSDGVLVQQATGGTISGNTALRNAGSGILIRASDGVSMTANTASSNAQDGIGVGTGPDRLGVSSGCRVSGNVVSLNARSGISAVVIDSFVAEENQATGNGGGGIVIDADELTEVDLRANRISAGSGDGMLVAGAGTIMMQANVVDAVPGIGLRVRDGRDVVVGNNQVSNTGGIAIGIVADGEARASGNSITGAGSTGISVEALAGAVGVALSGNTITGNKSHGIFIVGGTSGNVGPNEVRANKGAGILVRDSAGLTVAGNTVQANEAGGIEVGSVEPPDMGEGGEDAPPINVDFMILDNLLSGNARSGIRVVAGGALHIDRNRVSSSPTAGIAVLGDGSTVLSLDANDVSDSGTDGLSFSGVSSIAVSRTSVQRSGESGLHSRATGPVTISDSMILKSGQAGIDSVSSGAVIVQRNVVEDAAAVGISLVATPGNGLDVQISDNQIRRGQRGGLFVDGVVGTAIDRNTVEDSGAATMPDADGISVRHGTALSLSANMVRRSTGRGIAVGFAGDALAADIVFDRNVISDSGRAGITAFASGRARASSNVITHSGSSGLSLQSAAAQGDFDTVDNTVGTSAADGIFVVGSSAGDVRNNVVFSNAGSGIVLRLAANMRVVNNLSYVNGVDGISIGTAGQASPNATVLNNTIYRNGRTGLLIDSATLGSSSGATVLNNILQANAEKGVGVARNATANYVSGYNLDLDGYTDGTRSSGFDISADADFINPAGADGRLGGDNYIDDNFRLMQRRAGQTRNSPAIDAGSALAAVLGIDGSTATSNAPDVGRVDIGYHYSASATTTLTVPLPDMPLYVRQGGSNTNNGRDPRQAFASIQAAADVAAAGTTIVVGPGRYTETNIGVKNNSGRVTFFADPSGRATGEAPGPVLIDVAAAPDAANHDTGFVLLNGGPVTISGFHVTGAVQAGIQVRAGADGAIIHDNVVFSNQRRGIEVSGANGGEIRNNLVYANGTGGIRVAGSSDSLVLNNTVYANAQDGILIGGSADVDAAPAAAVLRNVVAANGVGIKVEPNSYSAGYETGYNVVFGSIPFSGSTPRADSDFIAEPLLVDPSGPDRQLGGSHYRDDDFHLLQSDAQTSPAVDIDFSARNQLAAGSTRVDGLPDLGPLDAGYHYPFLPLAAESPEIGTVVFVRQSGSDANSGASPAQALASIARAQAVGGAGGFIVIGPGRYAESGLRVGGSPEGMELPVLLGDSGGAFTGDLPGAVVIDADGRGAPLVNGPAVLDGLRFTGASGPGLRFSSRSQGALLRNSVVCGNRRGGVVLLADGIDIVNNLLCANGGDGLHAWLRRPGLPTRFINNSIVANRGRGLIVYDTTRAASRTLLINSVVAGNSGTGIELRGRGVPMAAANLNTDGYGRGTVPGSGDTAIPPGFVGGTPLPTVTCASSDDLRVADGSPVLEAGVGSPFEIGLSGRSVRADGQPDTGAMDLGYHYASGR